MSKNFVFPLFLLEEDSYRAYTEHGRLCVDDVVVGITEDLVNYEIVDHHNALQFDFDPCREPDSPWDGEPLNVGFTEEGKLSARAEKRNLWIFFSLDGGIPVVGGL